eukprot:CAMPEP_0176076416 /NCGR_PEP_ID=MMETSP0120_2-20121206/38201_1 /TAXON_ID=160619 /ORGANISM="Kryptoperidinium foliaceum, Strain CCMP 1326" /LENGTH=364 /DNA_ID=CAMNT_0017410135 /DNA_START=6 /DNA_END=1096 /DNA_ORIENTATION=+
MGRPQAQHSTLSLEPSLLPRHPCLAQLLAQRNPDLPQQPRLPQRAVQLPESARLKRLPVVLGPECRARLLRNARGLPNVAVLRQPADQRAIRVRVRSVEVRPRLHVFEDHHGPLGVPVVDACANQAGADMCIDIRPLHSLADPLGSGVRQLEGIVNGLDSFIQIPALAPHLDQDRNREVGLLDAVLLHLRQQSLGKLPVGALDATVQQGVEDDAVPVEAELDHPLERLQRCLEISAHAVTPDQHRVSDGIGSDPLGDHVRQHPIGKLHLARARARSDHGGENNMVQLYPFILHVPEESHGTVCVVDRCEALDQRRVGDGVALHSTLPLPEQRQGLIDTATLDERIDDTPERHAVWQHLPRQHVA